MSQGTPVIYSKETGIDGYFKEGTVGFGVNVNNFNFDEWDKAISNIITNYEKISANCLLEAKQFNWDYIAERYHGIYKKFLI